MHSTNYSQRRPKPRFQTSFNNIFSMMSRKQLFAININAPKYFQKLTILPSLIEQSDGTIIASSDMEFRINIKTIVDDRKYERFGLKLYFDNQEILKCHKFSEYGNLSGYPIGDG